jgi:hypothetical protein
MTSHRRRTPAQRRPWPSPLSRAAWGLLTRPPPPQLHALFLPVPHLLIKVLEVSGDAWIWLPFPVSMLVQPRRQQRESREPSASAPAPECPIHAAPPGACASPSPLHTTATLHDSDARATPRPPPPREEPAIRGRFSPFVFDGRESPPPAATAARTAREWGALG